MPTLDDAILFAASAHRGQQDRADLPYILHPLRVMLSVYPDEEAMMVAILHDVVEDTERTLDELLEEGYPERIVATVECLTKKKDGSEPYSRYIQRVKENPLATKVKIADLRDNADLSRLLRIEAYDLKRLDRYNRALQYLMGRYESPDVLID